MPNLLTRLKIDRVAAVDKGAGDGVRMLFWKRQEEEPYWKRDFTQAQRDAAADKGHALPDGSFPIENKGDVENAVQAIGRAKDPAKAKAHIKRRARALGATDMIPEDWGKALQTEDVDMTPEQIAKLVADEVAKANKPLIEMVAKLQHENAVLKMSEKHQAYHDALDSDDAKKAFASKTPTERDEHMSKNPIKKSVLEAMPEEIAKAVGPILQTVEAVTKRNAELETDVRKMREAQEIADFAKRAVDLGLPAAHGAVMRKAYAGDAAAIVEHEKMLKGMGEQIRTGKVFAEFGKTGGGEGTGATAYDQLMAKAEELRKVDPKLSTAQAFTKVYTNPANAELIKQYQSDQLRKIHKMAA